VRILSSVGLSISLLLIIACGTPAVRLPPFNDNDFSSYRNETGTGKIIGHAELYGVVLVPVTPYTQAIYEIIKNNVKSTERIDIRFNRYRRTTTTDDDGNFEFRNIPAGDYYLWEATASSGSFPVSGMFSADLAPWAPHHTRFVKERIYGAHTRIHVGDGEIVKVRLAQ